MRACDRLGISVQPARPGTPTDKGIVERTFLSIRTLFSQHVAGYLGPNVTRRGTVTAPAAWSVWPTTRARLRFDRITQPWLREPTKQFGRWRLSIGRSVNQAVIDILALNRFSGFLAHPQVTATSLAAVDRKMLERYLADLATDPRSTHSRSRDISSLNTFFHAVRRHGWDQTLPASATYYPDDFPQPDKRLPRALAEQVMAQVEQPTNLDRWHNPEGRLLTLVLMRCGLRVGDACNVAFDCIVRDADGAAYLRYLNRKMKREALVPIDEEVESEITAQQRRVLARWPDGSRWLFPAPRMNPDGTRPLTTHSYRGQLAVWLQRCEVRDEHSRPVHLTPHQWRHTFGTRLINRDVPRKSYGSCSTTPPAR